MRNTIAVLALGLAMLLAGCGGDAPATAAGEASTPSDAAGATPSADAAARSAVPPAAVASAAPGPVLPPPAMDAGPPPMDAWLGKWTGPEGTSLVLSRKGAGYDVVVTNLDGPATYAGVPVDAHIEFQRNGTRESIVAGNGAQTGMKWLAGKQHCLVIRPGEGFCRD